MAAAIQSIDDQVRPVMKLTGHSLGGDSTDDRTGRGIAHHGEFAALRPEGTLHGADDVPPLASPLQDVLGVLDAAPKRRAPVAGRVPSTAAAAAARSGARGAGGPPCHWGSPSA